LRVATVVEGVCVTLDPDFDFISVATGYLREQGYIEEGVRDFLEDRVTEVREAAESSVRLAPKLESALDRVAREDLHVRADIEDSEGNLRKLAARLILGLTLASGAVSTAMLYSFSTSVEAVAVAGTLTAGVALLLYRSFRTPKGIRAQPQFTRQNLRERGGDDRPRTGESAGPALGLGDAMGQDDVRGDADEES
jgi:hypothetical protein